MLACVSIGATVFSTGKMRYIDDTYGNLLDGPASANLAIARANRNVVYADRSLWRLISENSVTGNEQALTEFTDSASYFRKQVKKAARAMPSKAAAITRVANEFQTAVSGACATTVALGHSLVEADKRKAAQAMRTQ